MFYYFIYLPILNKIIIINWNLELRKTFPFPCALIEIFISSVNHWYGDLARGAGDLEIKRRQKKSELMTFNSSITLYLHLLNSESPGTACSAIADAYIKTFVCKQLFDLRCHIIVTYTERLRSITLKSDIPKKRQVASAINNFKKYLFQY